jgi:hypothetical protein
LLERLIRLVREAGTDEVFNSARAKVDYSWLECRVCWVMVSLTPDRVMKLSESATQLLANLNSPERHNKLSEAD